MCGSSGEDAVASNNRASRFFFGFLSASLSSFAGGQVITEFAVPTAASQPGGIAAGPDGNVWFTEFASGRIGRITPAGLITEFSLPDSSAGPSAITAGPDGALWFSEYSSGRLGRITTSGDVSDFPVAVAGLTAGPDGNLWSYYGNSIRRIGMTGAQVSFPVPGGSGGGIAVGPDGNIWFSDYYGGFIGKVTTAGTVTTFSMPDPDVGPVNLTAGSDGNLWIATAVGSLWKSTTQGVITPLEARLVGNPGYIYPYLYLQADGVALGADGNLWLTVGLDRIARLSPDGRLTDVFLPDPSAGPASIALGPDGNLWFTEFAGNRIGRLSMAAAGPCAANASTLCLANGRFQVQADWSAASLGRTDRASALSLSASSGSFWFFDRDSIELVVKMVDGCSVNGREWVFAAGMTNVGVSLVVTDTTTGLSREYLNVEGTPFPPVQDTAAFSTCP
jgi:streptogramin lyase